MSEAVKPIYIFSIPRSGSTLLQRILARHEDIASTAEPWIMLPYLYAMRSDGIYTEYHQKVASVAIREFVKLLPNGERDYKSSLRSFILDLYSSIEGGSAKYFLDKTPRYHLIAKELIDLFPDGRFIFLWRNPLSIIASLIELSSRKRWNAFAYKVDLFKGLAELISLYVHYKKVVFSVKYEDLVLHPYDKCEELCNYLGVTFRPCMLDEFNRVVLLGSMGDKAGVKRYKNITDEPIEKWRAVINNPLRKWWCRRYLQWIGADRLRLIGYDLKELLGDLSNVEVGLKGFAWDIARMCLGGIYCVLESEQARKKLQSLFQWYRIYPHC